MQRKRFCLYLLVIVVTCLWTVMPFNVQSIKKVNEAEAYPSISFTSIASPTSILPVSPTPTAFPTVQIQGTPTSSIAAVSADNAARQAALYTVLISLLGVIISTLAIFFAILIQNRYAKRTEQLEQAAIQKVAQVQPGNIQEEAASQLSILSRFNESVLRQAQQSFILALVAAIVGFVFFIVAVGVLILGQPQNISVASIISGALVDVISGVNFYLYGQASKQFSIFHQCLDRTQQYLLANSICENLVDDMKQEVRAEIVRVIVNTAANNSSEQKETSKN